MLAVPGGPVGVDAAEHAGSRAEDATASRDELLMLAAAQLLRCRNDKPSRRRPGGQSPRGEERRLAAAGSGRPECRDSARSRQPAPARSGSGGPYRPVDDHAVVGALRIRARSRCIQSVRRGGRGSAPEGGSAPPTLPVALGAVCLASLGRPYYPPRETARTE